MTAAIICGSRDGISDHLTDFRIGVLKQRTDSWPLNMGVRYEHTAVVVHLHHFLRIRSISHSSWPLSLVRYSDPTRISNQP